MCVCVYVCIYIYIYTYGLGRLGGREASQSVDLIPLERDATNMLREVVLR